MAYTTAAEYVSGIKLLDAPNQQAFARLVNEQWVRIMGLPGAYTEQGERFDSIVKHLVGGDLPLRIQGLKPRYLLNLTWREDPTTAQNHGQRHLDTRHVVYAIDPGLGLSADELNADERLQACGDLVAWLERGLKPDGDDVLAVDPAQTGLRWTKPLHPEDPARR